MDKRSCQSHFRQFVTEYCGDKPRSWGLNFTSSRICLQKHSSWFNGHDTFCNCLSKGAPSSYRFAQLPVGQKFSNAANALAEQVLDVQDQVRLRPEKSNARYKATANKKRKDKLFEEGDIVIVYLRKERIHA